MRARVLECNAPRELLASGYTLEVNGTLKAAFAVREGATARSCENVSKCFRDAQSKVREGSQCLNLVFLAFVWARAASAAPGLYELSQGRPAPGTRRLSSSAAGE